MEEAKKILKMDEATKSHLIDLARKALPLGYYRFEKIRIAVQDTRLDKYSRAMEPSIPDLKVYQVEFQRVYLDGGVHKWEFVQITTF